jgi:hypothetical protein
MGSSWFSTEDGKKGALAPGQLADLAVLSADYFSIPEEDIKGLESHLTIVGGKIVYANDVFSKLAPPELPVSPNWSPVAKYGGYTQVEKSTIGASHTAACIDSPSADCVHEHASGRELRVFGKSGLWSLGCDCFAF